MTFHCNTERLIPQSAAWVQIPGTAKAVLPWASHLISPSLSPLILKMEMIIKCLPQKSFVKIKWSNILMDHLAQLLVPNV